MYHRRTWDEFKTVLSVAHASQPVERAENLEYRNQLSGVCWGAVYCSSHEDLRSEFIFLNHTVYPTFSSQRSHIVLKQVTTPDVVMFAKLRIQPPLLLQTVIIHFAGLLALWMTTSKPPALEWLNPATKNICSVQFRPVYSQGLPDKYCPRQHVPSAW